MVIQGTKVPIYTNTLFLYFSYFSFFLMKKKVKQNGKRINKNMLNKAMHKTRLTQKQESKHTQVMQNQKQERGRERERERERKSD